MHSQKPRRHSGNDDVGGKMELSQIQLVGLIAAIWLSNFATALDSGLSASAHTAVANTFESANLATWPANTFLVCSLISQPIYARISDDAGRKLPFAAALAVFSTSLVLSPLCWSYIGLIVTRGLAGLGLGGIIGLASITLTDAVGLRKRAYFQAANYLIYGAGSAIGSGLGGGIVERYGWKWVYLIPAPCLALCLLVMACPRSHSDDITPWENGTTMPQMTALLVRFDWRGSLCLSITLSLTSILLLIGGNVYPWTHPLVLATTTASILSMVALFQIEVKAEKPILHFKMIGTFPILNLVICGFVLNMINYTTMYHAPTFFQAVLLETAEQASARLVVPSLAFTIVSAFTAFFIATRKTPYPTLYCSQFILLLGSGGLVFMAVTCSSLSLSWTNNLLLAIPVAGASMLAPSALQALLEFTDDTTHAAATGSFIMARSLGVLAATAAGTTILQNVFEIAVEYADLSRNDLQRIEDSRKDIRLITTLPSNLRRHVQSAFGTSFVCLFGFTLFAAIAVVISLRHIRCPKPKTETKEGDQA